MLTVSAAKSFPDFPFPSGTIRPSGTIKPAETLSPKSFRSEIIPATSRERLNPRICWIRKSFPRSPYYVGRGIVGNDTPCPVRNVRTLAIFAVGSSGAQAVPMEVTRPAEVAK